MQEYNPFKTALKRKQLSKPTSILLSKSLLPKDKTIIDFGCGYGNDVEKLKACGYNITGFDKFNIKFFNEDALNKKYDILICNYVFNTISSLKEHEEVLNQIKKLADNIYITVRADKKSVKPSWKWSCLEQGWWTSYGTFQRFYNTTVCNLLFGGEEEYTYLTNDSSMIIINIKNID